MSLELGNKIVKFTMILCCHKLCLTRAEMSVRGCVAEKRCAQIATYLRFISTHILMREAFSRKASLFATECVN